MQDSKKILVVEDSPTTRRQITDILEHAGYGVITAEDGEAALQMVREQHPDLVVLDIVLPKKNGYQVCRNIKRDPDLAIKVLMLTAKDQEKDKIWGQRQGADVYLAKPVDADELVAAVGNMVSPQVSTLNSTN
jgi:twitching motility two-component system response regulator PilH